MTLHTHLYSQMSTQAYASQISLLLAPLILVVYSTWNLFRNLSTYTFNHCRQEIKLNTTLLCSFAGLDQKI